MQREEEESDSHQPLNQPVTVPRHSMELRSWTLVVQYMPTCIRSLGTMSTVHTETRPPQRSSLSTVTPTEFHVVHQEASFTILHGSVGLGPGFLYWIPAGWCLPSHEFQSSISPAVSLLEPGLISKWLHPSLHAEQ